MKKKLCIVIQRYGNEIVGGAESYCRIYAEKLSQFYDIEVVTTCALDYQEWKNYYHEGKIQINGVNVRRFKVDIQRNLQSFGQLTGKIYADSNHTLEDSLKWVTAQGPVSYGLINYLIDNKDNFDLFVFMTYLYYHTAIGLEKVSDKAILIPFAHDEPPIYLKVYEKVFNVPRGIVYNTEEERFFIQTKFNNESIPSILTGIGIDIPSKEDYNEKDKKFDLETPYIVYIGRIDVSKGCDDLLNWFKEYKKNFNNNLKLVLMGKEVLEVPSDENIISLGFITEQEKYAVLSKSIALVMPSHFESLSIVVLEAFALGKPVLVSGHSEVLKGHCLKSNAGLYFYGQPDFIECLNTLYNDENLRSILGKNGEKYVEQNYRWEIILEKLKKFIDEMS